MIEIQIQKVLNIIQNTHYTEYTMPQLQIIIQQLNQIVSAQKTELQANNKMISSLNEKVMERDRKIVQLNQRLSQLINTNDKLQKQILTFKTLIKNHNQTLHLKNIKIEKLQNNLSQKVQQQCMKYVKKIKDLQNITSSQEEQIKMLMKDHEQMINSFEVVYKREQLKYDQQHLLQQFNDELMKQIEEVENINQRLLQNREKVETELALQNQQGNDLLCQVQAMMEHIQCN